MTMPTNTNEQEKPIIARTLTLDKLTAKEHEKIVRLEYHYGNIFIEVLHKDTGKILSDKRRMWYLISPFSYHRSLLFIYDSIGAILPERVVFHITVYRKRMYNEGN